MMRRPRFSLDLADPHFRMFVTATLTLCIIVLVFAVVGLDHQLGAVEKSIQNNRRVYCTVLSNDHPKALTDKEVGTLCRESLRD